MRFEIGREVRVLERRGGRGDVSFYVSIPKHFHTFLGTPDTYRVQLVGDSLLFLPVREVIVNDFEKGGSLENAEQELTKALSKRKPKSISCVKVLDHLHRRRVLRGGIVEVTVFCLGHKYESHALVKYGNDTTEVITEGLSCGYEGTSAGSTVWLVAELSQHARADTAIAKVERVVKGVELRGGAIRIEVSVLDNKVIVTPLLKE